MEHFKKTFIDLVSPLLLIICFFSACKRDEYYKDGGLAKGKFQGNIIQYLSSKPKEFDSLVQIIKLAGLDKTLSDEEVTFFAPNDVNIKALIGRLDQGGVNRRLYNEGKDTIKVLSDVDPLIWKKFLLRYIYKGKNKLMDYPQIDFGQQVIYPGQIYYAYGNTVANIGVVYNDAGGVRYMGYRQLHISYIPDISRPADNWRTIRVSSSDIEPNNGIVHVLEVSGNQLGFDQGEMENDISDSKR
ncbi:hypothetical protein [Pedobacter sp.]|jgi:hypothetical protein|uniref:hypothetical protein n=1 Tax=Pedobacter sp. TaxID=1411316 RepID=UPI002B668D6A|nr:hypothetical protein [Pedobacter sp.]HWW41027.1 hypothetical protein [Pedobacter sp.]